MVSASTRTRLLESAVGCIQDHGYADTTAREVAGRAGANLASIGYHFGSMTALLEEALVVATDRWITPLVETSRLGEPAGVRERLTSGLTAFVATLPEHRHTVIGFFEALARVERSTDLRRRLAADYDRLRAGLIGMATGDATDATAYDEAAVGGASAVIALYDGVMVQWLLDPERTIDVDALIDGLSWVMRPQRDHRVEDDVR